MGEREAMERLAAAPAWSTELAALFVRRGVEIVRINDDGSVWTNDDASQDDVREALRAMLAEYVRFVRKPSGTTKSFGEQMSDTTAKTGNSASGGTFTVTVPEQPTPQHAPSRASIACQVEADGSLALIPLDALGAYYLGHFGHSGDIHPAWHHRGLTEWETTRGAGHFMSESGAEKNRRTLAKVVLHSRTGPMLSKGEDPFWTGRGITPDDYKALVALLEKRQAARHREWRKANPRKFAPAKPKKGKTKPRRRVEGGSE